MCLLQCYMKYMCLLQCYMKYMCLLQEIAEPLMDLKVGVEDVRKSHTFRYVLATVLTIGNFLNGVQVNWIFCCHALYLIELCLSVR